MIKKKVSRVRVSVRVRIVFFFLFVSIYQTELLFFFGEIKIPSMVAQLDCRLLLEFNNARGRKKNSLRLNSKKRVVVPKSLIRVSAVLHVFYFFFIYV